VPRVQDVSPQPVPDLAAIRDRAMQFQGELTEHKQRIDPDFPWYPYPTMGNIIHLDTLLTGANRSVFDSVAGQHVADIGCADGDLGFFLEQELGCSVDLVDNGPTNINGLEGARRMRDAFGSSAQILDVDLDSQFALPADDYRVVFFLGLLYHLKNPFFAMEQLARQADFCFLSTRIAELSPDHATSLRDLPLAYLVDPYETNADPTNFWIFSDTGLRRLLDRTGWEILDYTTVGCTTGSDPSSPDRDERAFCLLRSRRNAA
jgi:tRNA (mo5U34)-methyltransferase